MDLAAHFASLFRGRTDAYGTEEGGCLRVSDQVRWTQVVETHLHGDTPVGVYPLMDDDTVWWGCVDFDEGDEESWVHSQNLLNVLATLGVVAWVERSRSKGYHVWVFAQEAVPAALMRTALTAACQIAQAPTREVNPKQTSRANLQKGYGNYVRLPYPKGHDWRRVMVDTEGEPISLEEFVSHADPMRTKTDTLKYLAELYEAPAPKPIPILPFEYTPDSEDLTRRMDGLTFTIFKDGPFSEHGEKGDRSGTLWKLAKRLYEHGYAAESALTLVRDADERWGKFIARGDDYRLEDMIHKVYVTGGEV